MVCMLASAMIAHLSACKFLFSGQKLAVARDQIRMCIGCLRSFEAVWPLAGRTLREVQAIAREVLTLPPQHQRAARVDTALDAANTQQDSTLAVISPDSFLNYLTFDDLPLCGPPWLTDC